MMFITLSTVSTNRRYLVIYISHMNGYTANLCHLFKIISSLQGKSKILDNIYEICFEILEVKNIHSVKKHYYQNNIYYFTSPYIYLKDASDQNYHKHSHHYLQCKYLQQIFFLISELMAYPRPTVSGSLSQDTGFSNFQSTLRVSNVKAMAEVHDLVA